MAEPHSNPSPRPGGGRWRGGLERGGGEQDAAAGGRSYLRRGDKDMSKGDEEGAASLARLAYLAPADSFSMDMEEQRWVKEVKKPREECTWCPAARTKSSTGACSGLSTRFRTVYCSTTERWGLQRPDQILIRKSGEEEEELELHGCQAAVNWKDHARIEDGYKAFNVFL